MAAVQASIVSFADGMEGLAHFISRTSAANVLFLLKRYGASVGEFTRLHSPLYIQNAISGDLSNLRIGRHCYLGYSVLFDLVETVEIGDDCSIAAFVAFVTHFDCGERPLQQFYERQTGGIRIGAGTFLGTSCVVLHGVTIGECCVIAAGSVVTHDIPAHSVAAGVPARVSKKLQN